jgi:hypothetical protein
MKAIMAAALTHRVGLVVLQEMVQWKEALSLVQIKTKSKEGQKGTAKQWNNRYSVSILEDNAPVLILAL